MTGGCITVASGGAFNLTSDNATNGYAMIYPDCGATNITVQTGGVLDKTGGTGTSTIGGGGGITTVQGTLEAATGSLVAADLTLEQGVHLIGDVLPTGTTATCFGQRDHPQVAENVPWTGATIEGSGTLTVASGATLSADASGNATDYLESPLVVNGTGPCL